MKVDGQCHCGAIAFEAELDPANVVICHCTDCQALTGSAYRAIARADGPSFKLTRGAPKVYVKKTADNGNLRRHAFCAECGSPIYATSMDEPPPAYSLRLGNVRQRDQLEPTKQQWRKSALSWAIDLSSVPSVEKQ